MTIITQIRRPAAPEHPQPQEKNKRKTNFEDLVHLLNSDYYFILVNDLWYEVTFKYIKTVMVVGSSHSRWELLENFKFLA